MARALVDLGLTRLELGKFAEAEASLRDGLAILEKATPDGWERFDALVLLGAALAGQKKYAEAEPLMLSGYEGLKARESSIPAPNRGILADAGRPDRRALHRLGQAREGRRVAVESEAGARVGDRTSGAMRPMERYPE